MENEDGVHKKWGFSANNEIDSASGIKVREVLNTLMNSRNPEDERQAIRLGHGDPSAFPFIVDSLRSAKFNGYSPSVVGILPARRSIEDYLSRDLPYKLSPADVFLTVGCTQAIDIAMMVYPYYEACAEYQHFDLLPDKGWEVDLEDVQALADENTVGMVIINRGNPCGSVYTYENLKKVAKTANKPGILVIADEVYGYLTFASNPFVPMGVFGSIAHVLTLGSISKRWLVPGWRLGWFVVSGGNDRTCN
ncbi:hypothetical protein MKX03_003114 [Papaver bracteatum]|nr:hypothetical protein MKX03_003114 [Papaver bracteatum]